MANEYKRYPFLLRPMKDMDISINKELLFNGRDIFINKNGNIESIIMNDIVNTVKEIADSISSAMDGKYTSLTELINEHEKMKEKINKIETGDDNTLPIQEILDKYYALNMDDTIKKQIDKKVDINTFGGILSDNDFTDELKSILDSVDFNVKKYTHPKVKQCNYEAPVQSVFGRTGDIIITKEDFNLGSIDPNANNYIHPRKRQCNPKHVTSVNGITLPNIKITKGTIGLGVLDNKGVSRGGSNIDSKVSDKYLVYDQSIKKYIDSRVSKIKEIKNLLPTVRGGITVASYPKGTKPNETINIVTVYSKELVISRAYGNHHVHNFELPPGEYKVKIEGFNKDGLYTVVYKTILMHRGYSEYVDLKESGINE